MTQSQLDALLTVANLVCATLIIVAGGSVAKRVITENKVWWVVLAGVIVTLAMVFAAMFWPLREDCSMSDLMSRSWEYTNKYISFAAKQFWHVWLVAMIAIPLVGLAQNNHVRSLTRQANTRNQFWSIVAGKDSASLGSSEIILANDLHADWEV
jgi:Na+/H+ antiporter NhaA